MILEFKVFKANEDNHIFEISKNKTNEFIVVAEEGEYYRVHQLDEQGGFSLVQGLSIVELAFYIKKKDLKLSDNGISYEVIEVDVPKEYLNMDIVEEIQRLNN